MLHLIGNNKHHLADSRIPIHTEVFLIDSVEIFGKTIADLEIEKLTGCTAIAVRREGMLARFPDIHLPLLEGDQITVFGTNAQLVNFGKVFGLSRMVSPAVSGSTRRIA